MTESAREGAEAKGTAAGTAAGWHRRSGGFGRHGKDDEGEGAGRHASSSSLSPSSSSPSFQQVDAVSPEHGEDPISRTEDVLPERTGRGGRVLRAIRAAREKQGPEPLESQVASTSTASPAQLTLPEGPGPVARLKRSWENTDYFRRLEQMIVEPQLARCVTIAFVSPKGGVGKTTVTALVGTLLAYLRRDLVLAIDSNPDYGSLGRVLTPDHRFFVDDMADYVELTRPSPADLNARLGVGPHGLRVLPAPTDPTRMAGIGYDIYRRLITTMKEYGGVLLLDCGTGLHEPPALAALEAADQVVVVSDEKPATASLVSEAALRMTIGKQMSFVVNTMPRHGSRLDLQRLAATLPGLRHLVVIPEEDDAAAALGLGSFGWDDAPLGWQRAVRELCATLVSGWSDLGVRRS